MTMTTTTPHIIEDVSDLLNRGVSHVFSTMVSLEVEPTPSHRLESPNETIVAGSVGFIGDVNGIVYLRVTTGFAQTLAKRMLGFGDDELVADEMVNDVIGELNNMIVGFVKSRLCDSGSSCVLTIPSIVRGQNFSVEPVSSSERRVLGFHSGANYILIELLIKNHR